MAFPACSDLPLTAHLEPRGCQQVPGTTAHCGILTERGVGSPGRLAPPELQQLSPVLHPAVHPAIQWEPRPSPHNSPHRPQMGVAWASGRSCRPWGDLASSQTC